MKAVLRRSGSAPAPPAATVVECGDLHIDLASHEVRRGDAPVPLTAREFALLAYLAQRPRVVASRDELLEHVWGYTYGDPATVTVHVRRLREKIEADPSQPRHLVTVWGHGYRWDA